MCLLFWRAHFFGVPNVSVSNLARARATQPASICWISALVLVRWRIIHTSRTISHGHGKLHWHVCIGSAAHDAQTVTFASASMVLSSDTCCANEDMVGCYMVTKNSILNPAHQIQLSIKCDTSNGPNICHQPNPIAPGEECNQPCGRVDTRRPGGKRQHSDRKKTRKRRSKFKIGRAHV